MFGIEDLEKRLRTLEQKTDEQVKAIESQHKTVESQFRTQQTRLSALGDDTSRLDDQLTQLRDAVVKLSAQVRNEFELTRRSTDGLRDEFKKKQRREKALAHEIRLLVRDVGRLTGAYYAEIDPRFHHTATPLVESRRTMLGFDRLLTLWQASANVARLDLPSVEIGTFKGGSAALLTQALRLFAGVPRELHVVDTFEGHIDATITSHDHQVQRGKFKGTSYDDVRTFLEPYEGVHVHQGDASQVIVGWPERRYALVHVDVDLYKPTIDCLDYFGSRLATGGVIIVDDYEAPSCPGVHLAVHEFLDRNPGFQAWRMQGEQVTVLKIGA